MTTNKTQIDRLCLLLQRLAAFEINWRLSPNGAMLQHDGRMVAMVLLNESPALTVSPKESDDHNFDLADESGLHEAVDFIARLKESIVPTPSIVNFPAIASLSVPI